MFRILVADDEGIMLESIKSIILSNFGSECEVMCVKTGRAVIEQGRGFQAGHCLCGHSDARAERYPGHQGSA